MIRNTPTSVTKGSQEPQFSVCITRPYFKLHVLEAPAPLNVRIFSTNCCAGLLPPYMVQQVHFRRRAFKMCRAHVA